jgi:hypothetical protein
MRTLSTAFAGVTLALAPLTAAPDMPVRRETSSHLTLRFEAGGLRTVDLRTISGSIRVTTENRDDVRLTLTRRTRAEREADLITADRDVRLDTSTRGAAVAAFVRDREQTCGENFNSGRDSWWDRQRYHVDVDLTAVIPAGTRVRLCTINGEAVIATGAFDDFDVSNVNGRIELSGVRGSGRATTVNGPVTVTFAGAPRDNSEFKSVNGDITVAFPSNLDADLQLKTMHGELLTDFDVEPLPMQAQATRSTAKGRYVYKAGGATRVRVGRGGPELNFETLNGDVRILRGGR